MGDWSYLSLLLDKVQSHSTVVGKIWMSVLFLFRIFILGAAADQVWDDELSDFYCDNKEPGCVYACYNQWFPISHVRYWVLQIVFVSTPTLVYLGHAVFIVHREKRMKESGPTRPKYTDERGKVKIHGILFCTYMTQLVFKLLLEVAFTVGQLYIFKSPFIALSFPCKTEPCSSSTGVECYVSRPTEKTFFVFFMFGVTGMSVLLTLVEMLYLLCKRRRKAMKLRRAQQLALSRAPGQQYGFAAERGFLTPPPQAHYLPEVDGQHEETKEKDS